MRDDCVSVGETSSPWTVELTACDHTMDAEVTRRTLLFVGFYDTRKRQPVKHVIEALPYFAGHLVLFFVDAWRGVRHRFKFLDS